LHIAKAHYVNISEKLFCRSARSLKNYSTKQFPLKQLRNVPFAERRFINQGEVVSVRICAGRKASEYRTETANGDNGKCPKIAFQKSRRMGLFIMQFERGNGFIPLPRKSTNSIILYLEYNSSGKFI